MRAERTKTFLVESYVPHLDGPTAATMAGQVERAVAELQRLGIAMVWLRSVVLLGEETCFSMFSAQKVDHVIEANERAGVAFDHVVEVVTIEARS